MSAKLVCQKADKKERDPDFVKAETAMKRAAQKARERARLTGVGVVFLKDGRIVEELPG